MSQMEEIREVMVLSKLAESVIIDKFHNKPIVVIDGIIIPYGIFTSCLMRYGVWKLRFSKATWFEMNNELIAFWKFLNVLPYDCSMKAHKLKPTTIIKKAINNYEHENQNEVDYYGDHSLALLHTLEAKLKELEI